MDNDTGKSSLTTIKDKAARSLSPGRESADASQPSRVGSIRGIFQGRLLARRGSSVASLGDLTVTQPDHSATQAWQSPEDDDHANTTADSPTSQITIRPSDPPAHAGNPSPHTISPIIFLEAGAVSPTSIRGPTASASSFVSSPVELLYQYGGGLDARGRKWVPFKQTDQQLRTNAVSLNFPMSKALLNILCAHCRDPW
jgi:hypothetical protein